MVSQLVFLISRGGLSVGRQNTATKREPRRQPKTVVAPNRFLPVKGYVGSVDDTPKTAQREGLLQRRGLVLEVAADESAAFSRQVALKLVEQLVKFGYFDSLQVKVRSGRSSTEECRSVGELVASFIGAEEKQIISAKFYRGETMVFYLRAESYVGIPAPSPYDDRLVLAAYYAEDELETVLGEATVAVAKVLRVSVDPDFVGEPLPSLGLVRRLFDWAFVS
jgi:hypothetical protein